MHKFTSVTQVPPSMAVTMVAVPYLLMELNVHSNLLQLIRDEGKWGGWVPMSYHPLATLSPPE